MMLSTPDSIYESTRITFGQIRVLVIHPGAYHEPIKCHFEVISLADVASQNAAYDALSYTWGSLFSEDPLFISDVAFIVTKSLFNALTRIRPANGPPRALWADAVCIHQLQKGEENKNKAKEVSEQMNQMWDIYKSARATLVWLGDGDGESALAFQLMYRLAPWDDKSIRDAICDTTLAKDWDALFEIWDRPYWKRLWIIQELVANKTTKALCGGDECDMEILFFMVLSLSQYRLEFQTPSKGPTNPEFSKIPSQLQKFQCAIRGRPLNEWQYQLAGPRQGDRDLLQVIKDYRGQLATDPKDRVLAVVGLAKPYSHGQFKIDAGLGAGQVYTRAAQHIIRGTRKLNVIYEGLDRPLSRPDLSSYLSPKDRLLSSWVPDWSGEQEMVTVLERNSEQPWKVARESEAEVSFSPCGAILTAKGIHIGSITNTIPILSEGSFGALETIFRNIFNLAVHGRSHDTAASMEDRAQKIDALWKTTIRGRCFHDLNNNHIQQEFTDLCEMLNCSIHRPSTEQIPGQSLGPSDLTEYVMLIWEIFARRKFFVCASGTMGMGPPTVRGDDEAGRGEGDVVAVLLGCDFPVVLRPRKERGYQFLGEAYVNGFMQGQALKGLERGDERAAYKFEIH